MRNDVTRPERQYGSRSHDQILGLQPRDKAAILGDKTIFFAAFAR